MRGAPSPTPVWHTGLRARLEQVVTCISFDVCVALPHLQRVRLLRDVADHISLPKHRVKTPDPSSYATYVTGPMGLQVHPDWSPEASAALRYAWHHYTECRRSVLTHRRLKTFWVDEDLATAYENELRGKVFSSIITIFSKFRFVKSFPFFNWTTSGFSS